MASPPASRITPKDLTRLVAKFHPDRWHGKAAIDLAHEVSIALLDLRQQLETEKGGRA
jgi:hypothetical protein